MTLAAVALVLLSAALHVAWNLRSRQARPTAAFFAISIAASALLLTPVLVWHAARVGPVLDAIWPLLLATSVFSTLYNVALAAAYRTADLSLVYPLARSLAPVGVVAAAVVLGRGELLGPGLWLGVPIILIGTLLLPLDRWAQFRPARYLQAGVLLPLLTAAGTAGYTLVDDAGVRGTATVTALSPLVAGVLYAALHAWATTAGLVLTVALRSQGRRELRQEIATRFGAAVWVGVISYASYGCVLVAMGLAREVSYVAAFRQAGVPLSVLAGAWVLGERVGRIRALGVALVTLGLVAVAWR